VAVERWLENRGDKGAATRVYLAMRRRDRAEGVGFFTRLRARVAAVIRRFRGGSTMTAPDDAKGGHGMGPFARLADWIVDKTTLYGLQIWRPALVLVPMLILTFLLFLNPNALTASMPEKDGNATKAPAGEQRRPSQADWSSYDALLMTFHLHFPGLSFGVGDRWKPSPDPIPVLGWPTYSGWAFGVSLLSPALVSLFGAGVASIVRKPREEKDDANRRP
jgi:hypothetical protein